MMRIVLSVLSFLIALTYCAFIIPSIYALWIGTLLVLFSLLMWVDLEILMMRKQWRLLPLYFGLNIDLRNWTHVVRILLAFSTVILSYIDNKFPLFALPHVFSAYAVPCISLLELTLTRDSRACSYRTFHVIHMQHRLLLLLPTVIFISEVSLCVGVQFNTCVEQFFLVCVMLMSVHFLQQRTVAPQTRKPLELIQGTAENGGTQGSPRLPKFQDSDGSIANEFYYHNGHSLEQIPKGLLKKLN